MAKITMLEEVPCWAYPEWDEFLARWVPERGQADTVQGELLRDAIRLSGQYGNNGLGNWLEKQETYEAFAEILLQHLCDGTFDAENTVFIRRVIERARAFGRREIAKEESPSALDVDKIAGYAILWCLRHPDPIPRQYDGRMAF